MSDETVENYARDKLLELEVLAERIAEHKADGERVGLCHGCFDILHLGHLRHFIAAREHCDRLVVTVTPDRFVGKGPDRPVFAAEYRAELIAGLEVVHYVGINRWPSAVETLRLLKPSRFFKNREYDVRPEEVNPNFLLEAEVVRELGGEVVFTGGFVLSSSAAWSRIKSSV